MQAEQHKTNLRFPTPVSLISHCHLVSFSLRSGERRVGEDHNESMIYHGGES
jgi:hypothetical protein